MSSSTPTPTPLQLAALKHFTNSPTPFHNCQNLCASLDAAGFTALDEMNAWKGNLLPGGKYYYTRNGATLVAFTVGGKWDSKSGGFKIIGGHTDSPNLRLKPKSLMNSASPDLVQLSVECYGGGLWHTWFDRDLSLAGRVLVRSKEGRIEQRLVKLNRPVCRIPSLCIHLQSGEERAAFNFNKEEQLQPVLAQMVQETLGSPAPEKEGEKKSAWAENHPNVLMGLLAEELGCDVKDIVDFEVSLYDTQPASLGGANNEFLYSARLDNQATCIVSIESLIEYSKDVDALAKDMDCSGICLFDHEEVGSASFTGAGSPIMGEFVRRVTSALNTDKECAEGEDFFQRMLRKSFVLSVDQAHAVHPNWPGKHMKTLSPKMNGGFVIKTNSNQRYTTNSFSGFIVREICRRLDLPVQEFAVRNDCPCGSTIGPIIAEKTGMRSVDGGMAQLSMHSIREVMGVKDLDLTRVMFLGFWKMFREIDENCFECA